MPDGIRVNSSAFFLPISSPLILGLSPHPGDVFVRFFVSKGRTRPKPATSHQNPAPNFFFLVWFLSFNCAAQSATGNAAAAGHRTPHPYSKTIPPPPPCPLFCNPCGCLGVMLLFGIARRRCTSPSLSLGIGSMTRSGGAAPNAGPRLPPPRHGSAGRLASTLPDVCGLPVLTSSWKAIKSLDEAYTEVS